MAAASAPVATLKWTLPADWKELPGDKMRVGHFVIPGPDNQTADVTVVPLRGVAASRTDIVNLWRKQVNLPLATEADLGKLTEKVEIAGAFGDLFDMAGEKAGAEAKEPLRILVGMLGQEDTTWFFKVTGPNALVVKSKPDFLNFLKSVAFLADAPNAMAPAAPSAMPSAMPSAGMGMGQMPLPEPSIKENPQWQVPTDWQSVPAGPMMNAKFAVASPGAKAEVTISVLAGDGGGALDNVNRWRGQMSLPPVGMEEMGKTTSPLDLGGAKALKMDVQGTFARTGQPARMIAVSVPQGGRTWFYKMVGDGKLVEAQQEAFLKFVQTARYPGKETP